MRCTKKCNFGITLVELIVAIVVSGLIVTVAYSSWIFLSRHTSEKKRQTQFRLETENIARSIISKIRRSSKVLYYDESSIVFLAPESKDTVRYSFNEEYLFYNEDTITYLSPGIRCVNFKVEQEEEDELTATENVLFNLHFHFENSDSSVSKMDLTVHTKYFQEEGDEFDFEF